MEIATEAPLGQAHPEPPPAGARKQSRDGHFGYPGRLGRQGGGITQTQLHTAAVTQIHDLSTDKTPAARHRQRFRTPAEAATQPRAHSHSPSKGVSGDPAWFELADLQGARRSLRWTSVRTEPCVSGHVETRGRMSTPRPTAQGAQGTKETEMSILWLSCSQSQHVKSRFHPEL